MRDQHLERVTATVIDCGFRLHSDLGPGLLETAYELLLAEDLRRLRHHVARQVTAPLKYNGIVIDNAFRIDLLVEQRLIIEIKSVERLMPVHGKQVLTYLKLMDLRLAC